MALIGGVLIGIAATLMLLYNGRVTGVSGIAGSLLEASTPDKSWRIAFISGLLIGGLVLKLTYPTAFRLESVASTLDYILAGLLVGVGTTMGSGCTSGHGVCGISRLSVRSLTATIIFILTGMVSLYVFKMLRGDL